MNKQVLFACRGLSTLFGVKYYLITLLFVTLIDLALNANTKLVMLNVLTENVQINNANVIMDGLVLNVIFLLV